MFSNESVDCITNNHIGNPINIPLFLKKRIYQNTRISNSSVPKVAVFFDLEHFTTSAIANYSAKTFGLFPNKFHIYTRFSSSSKAWQVLQTIALKLNKSIIDLSIFDITHYEEMDSEFNYLANIFVLGDSPYHLDTFNALIHPMYKHRHRNYLYLHDGIYIHLFYAWVVKNNYNWDDFLQQTYPDFNQLDFPPTSDNLLPLGVTMLAHVIRLSNCHNIFVNTPHCISIIQKEINYKPINITPSFLPISDYRDIISETTDSKTFLIAHFGMPNHFKQLDKLIKAVDHLRKKENSSLDIKLLLAGYGIDTYINQLPLNQQKFIIGKNAVSQQEILSLMKRANIIVQLRWPINGQASGVISEIIGIGRKCITTQNFVNNSLKNWTIEVSPDITSKKLAEVIWKNRDKTIISAEDHHLLLQQFSPERSSDLILNTVYNNTLNVESYKVQRKLRILYGASHRILRYEEVPLLIKAGFEVIPVKAHWDIFKSYEPSADDPSHQLYPNWKNSCSIPEEIIEKLQSIDILKYQDLNAQGGIVSPEEAALINEWIDIVYIPNLLPVVPRVLSWFEGLTVFRVYGEGKIMTYNQWAVESNSDLSLLRKYDARYAAMLLLHTLEGQEHEYILGSNIFHVGTSVSPSRITQSWKGESASPTCNIVLSYIMQNHHWTDMYHKFSNLLKELPVRFLGKNEKNIEPNKSDDRIIGIIENENEYMNLLTDCRCLVDPGTSPFHAHYSTAEAIIMGIPVIFLEDSGRGLEMRVAIPESNPLDYGMCKNFQEMRMLVEKCLEDIQWAQKLSSNQRIIAEKLFSPSAVEKQIRTFAEAAPHIVAKAKGFAPLYRNDFSNEELYNKNIFGRLSKSNESYPSLIPISLNEEIGMSCESPKIFLSQGWSHFETWGIWSDGTMASLVVSTKNLPTKFCLELSYIGFVSSLHQKQLYEIVNIHDQLLERCSFEYGLEEKKVKLHISQERDIDNDNLVITIKNLNPCTPKDAGYESGDRLLGIGISCIKIIL